MFNPPLLSNIILFFLSGLAYIPGILVVCGMFSESSTPEVCSFRVCFNFFVNFLNRLIPVGIVTYRYVYVCKSHWVQNGKQREIFQFVLIAIILSLIFGLTVGCYVYRENYLHFWLCLGRNGFAENDNFNGFHFHLPIYNPFHFLSVFIFFLHSLVLPVGYLAIYRFRVQQNLTVAGLSTVSRNRRKKRNVVTAKFNAIIWLSEFCSYLVIIPEGNFFFVLYFLISGTISPILYCLGIEENRKESRERILEIFKDSKNNRGSEDNDIHI